MCTSGLRLFPAGAEHLLQLERRGHLELVIAAIRGRLVGAPALEDGRVAEAVALQVVVLHFADPLGPHRLPAQVLAAAPAALGSRHPIRVTCGGVGPVLPRVLVHGILAQVFELNGHTIYTSASIGIAVSSEIYRVPDEILRDADIAMYRAKNSGQATYAVFDTYMHDQAMFQHRMETDLRRALDKGEFEIYYQPIIAMDSERVQGFEALLRWHHPSRGLVMPDEFIGTVEDTSLVAPIGWWVIEHACHQLAIWQRLFPVTPALAMSINVSGKLFLTDDMAKRLAVLLEDCGLAPNTVRLEITERVVMDHGDLVLSTLSDLRELGVELHIDDFGTGYSSLSYLQRFRYDTLKIDRSFVQTMTEKIDSSAIVETIITLGVTLGMKVVAEGVETADQVKRLRAMRCPSAQGYWYSRPMDHDAVNDYLRVGARPAGELPGPLPH